MAIILLLFYILLFALILSCFIFAIYLLLLLIYSQGFRENIVSLYNYKSIYIIIKYIKEYIKNNSKSSINVVNISSGYGRNLFLLNKKLKQNILFTGIESSKFLFLISKLFNKSSNISFTNYKLDAISNLNYDIIISSIPSYEHKKRINLYNKIPKGSKLILWSSSYPFDNDKNFLLISTMHIFYRWNIYIILIQ